ncbi:MAG: hypothetical protein A2Z72_03435 [Omnitrophica bacterium RBG_13_46_9]|nr:MAG: hypothetical protein A2Z72_03435 [Omnitrophica bacterium RBG_13_46_9]
MGKRMNNKHLIKLTKSELIKTLIFSFLLALIFIYSFYKSTTTIRNNSMLLIICTAIGLVILFLSIYTGIKIGLKNRKRITVSLEKNEKYKLIWAFGILAMLFGAFLNTNAIFKIAWLLGGFGLTLVKKWGFYTFITLAIIYSLLIVVDLLSGNSFHLLGQILSDKAIGSNFAIGLVILIRGLTLAFCISGIYYLTRPKVKKQFK